MATTRMASLLDKVVMKTSLVRVEVASAPTPDLANANGERIKNHPDQNSEMGRHTFPAALPTRRAHFLPFAAALSATAAAS